MLVNDVVELGDLIRRRRTGLGLSQTELAERISSTRQWVSRLERGKHDISTARLFAVLDALELNLDLRPPRATTASPLGPGTTSKISDEVLNAISRSARTSVEPSGLTTEGILENSLAIIANRSAFASHSRSRDAAS